MRVVASIEINAPPQAVWEFIDEPSRYLGFMSGITRWEVADPEHPRGLGARYRMLMHVGSAEVGGLVEVVEHLPPTDLAWTSIVGIDQRGRWRLRDRGLPHAPRTHVELRLSYGVAGAGFFGWLAERAAAPTVRKPLRRSLQQLKRQVEHEQLRAAAAERRSRRGASQGGSRR